MTTNIQFKARVNNGKIEIPLEYQDEIHNAEIVEIVILQLPKKKHFSQTGMINQLTANPIKIADFQPLTREQANERW